MITIEHLKQIKDDKEKEFTQRENGSQGKWKALGVVELIDYILDNGIEHIEPANRDYEGKDCVYWNYWGCMCELTGLNCNESKWDHCDQYEPAE